MAIEDESDGSKDGDDDEKMALIIRKFKKFMKKRRQVFTKRPLVNREPNKDKDKEQPPVCYECKKLGHFKVDCSLLKQAPKKNKKKAMLIT